MEGPLQHLGHAPVDVGGPAVGVEDPYALGRGVDEVAQPRVALAQGVFDLLAGGDVGHQRQDARQALLVGDGARPEADVDRLAILAPAHGLHALGHGAAQDRLQIAPELLPPVVRHKGHGKAEDFVLPPAEDALGRRVPQAHDPFVGLQEHDRERAGLDQRAERLVQAAERLHALVAPAERVLRLVVEARVVQGQGRPVADLLGERQVRGAVRKAAFAQCQADGAEHAAPRHHGDEDVRAGPDLEQELQMPFVPRPGAELLLGELGHELGLARAQDPAHSIRGTEIRREAPLDLAHDFLEGRVAVQRLCPPDSPFGVEDVDDAVVGEVRYQVAGEGGERLLLVQGRGERVADFGQDPALRLGKPLPEPDSMTAVLRAARSVIRL